MPIEQLLAAPRNRNHLKSRLVKSGLLAPRCNVCGLAKWRKRAIALELHHVNGDGLDNRLDNLVLLCPNCHSQTDSRAQQAQIRANSCRATREELRDRIPQRCRA